MVARSCRRLCRTDLRAVRHRRALGCRALGGRALGGRALGGRALGAALLVGLLPALLWTEPARAEPPGAATRLRIGTIAPGGTPWADQLKDFKTRVERESEGRIKVLVYLGGRKGDETRLMTLLRRGKLQGAALSNGAVAAVVPEFRVLELPYLFESDAEADYVIDEVAGPELERRAIARGLFIGIWSENGWRSIATKNRPVRRLEDVKGLSVRAQETPTNLAFWDALGARKVPIPLDEVLIALQSDVIQGFDQTPVYMAAAGWITQVRFVTLTRHIYQPGMLVLNKRFLDDLSPELREIVLRGRGAESRRGRIAVRAANRKVVERFAENEIAVIELNPAELARLRERERAVWSTLREQIGPELIDRVSTALAARRAAASGDGGGGK